jgi:hypothetical protein
MSENGNVNPLQVTARPDSGLWDLHCFLPGKPLPPTTTHLLNQTHLLTPQLSQRLNRNHNTTHQKQHCNPPTSHESPTKNTQH